VQTHSGGARRCALCAQFQGLAGYLICQRKYGGTSRRRVCNQQLRIALNWRCAHSAVMIYECCSSVSASVFASLCSDAFGCSAHIHTYLVSFAETRNYCCILEKNNIEALIEHHDKGELYVAAVELKLCKVFLHFQYLLNKKGQVIN
jgi:hypothetical protein